MIQGSVPAPLQKNEGFAIFVREAALLCLIIYIRKLSGIIFIDIED